MPSRPVPGLVTAAAVAFSAVAGHAQEPHQLPGVEVSRVILEARVLDGRGRALPGLGPEDFRLEVDGRTVPLEAAVWVPDGVDQSGAPSPSDLPSRVLAESDRPGEIPGRLITLLFQKDHRGSRLHGLLRMIAHSSDLLDQFGPRDRVAVVVFDTQLRLHLDFTDDRRLVERTLSRSVLDEWPDPLPPGPTPSLAAEVEPDRARAAGTPEAALLVLAQALDDLPGSKQLLILGWGVGQMVGGVVTLSADYTRAREVFNRSHTSVFSIDIVDADYHSLEPTLEQVARDTGGLYLRTADHPGGALARLAEALSGHYVLSFEPPDGPRGEHRVQLGLADRGGTVLTRSRYVD